MRLHQYREANGLSYRALARLLGVETTKAFRLATGKLEPSLSDIRLIEAATAGAVTVGDWMADAP